LLEGRIDPGAYLAAAEYISPVQLFTSGAEAADHGQARISRPSPLAVQGIQKVRRARTDLIHTLEL
jgi:hypothetical protein